jgi:hypothetical protein
MKIDEDKVFGELYKTYNKSEMFMEDEQLVRDVIRIIEQLEEKVDRIR